MIQKQLLLDNENVVLIATERMTLTKLEKWSLLEEIIWHQKSKAYCIRLGDLKTKFFFAHVKEWQSQNAIKMLIIEDGSTSQTHDQLKEEVTLFYKKLMGSVVERLPMVERAIVGRGVLLNLQQ